MTLERVRELDEKIEDSQIQSKHLKEELFNEQTAARLLSEENTRLKNVLSLADHSLTTSEQEDG